MSLADSLYQIADQLRSIASNGLRFAENGYDRERYEQVLKESARIVAALEGASPEAVLAQYTGGLPHLSPIVCVEAVVVRDLVTSDLGASDPAILLIQRRDDRCWAIPGGVAEVGETTAQAAERELWEEAGVRGRASRLLGVFDSRLWHSRSRLQLCVAMFLVETQDVPGLHAGNGEERSRWQRCWTWASLPRTACPSCRRATICACRWCSR